MTFLKYTANIVGLTAGGMLANEVFVSGKRRGLQKAKVLEANHLSDVYIRSQSGSGSLIENSMKKGYTRFILDSKLYASWLKASNIVSTTFNKAVDNIIPIGLAVLAIFANVNKKQLDKIKIPTTIKGGFKKILPKKLYSAIKYGVKSSSGAFKNIVGRLPNVAKITSAIALVGGAAFMMLTDVMGVVDKKKI